VLDGRIEVYIRLLVQQLTKRHFIMTYTRQESPIKAGSLCREYKSCTCMLFTSMQQTDKKANRNQRTDPRLVVTHLRGDGMVYAINARHRRMPR